MRRGVFGVACALIVGCTSASEPEPLPPAPDDGVQLVLPEMRVEPGVEQMLCWYTTIPTGVDWIASMQSFQTVGGHHVIGFTTDETHEEVPDGTVLDCIDPGAISHYVPLLTPTLSPSEDDRVDLPDGLALHMRAGSRLVLQSHYVNTTNETIVARDVVNLWAAKDPSAVQPAAPYMTQSFDHVIPRGGTHGLSYDCPIPADLDLYSAVGHMHESGTSIRISVGDAAAVEEIYRVDAWEDAFRDAPPMEVWPLEQPHSLHAGDVVRVECTWDTGLALDAVSFPEEMCAALLWLYPLDEPLFCAGTP